MNPREAKRLGNYLRKAREQRGLSQAGLGNMIDVPNSTILRLERGENLMPRHDLLANIAKTLSISLADVYALAGYATPDDLPALTPYLRTKYRGLPESATDAITAYAERLAKRHGVNLSGPAPGEDELPEPTTTTSKKKGGTSRAAGNRSRR